MRIVADENIACLDESFGRVGELITHTGRALDRNLLEGADALIVRSVTRVDAQLLEGTSVRFVGSCTIGTDHVDLDYLSHRKIHFAHAPGCNAKAVAEYVLTAIFHVSGNLSEWKHRRVGIVGYGNVGRQLAQILDVLGITWVSYDPLVEQNQRGLGSFADVLSCDIVSIHTPLTRPGPYATHHWFGKDVLDQLKDGALLINAARGAIVSNADLKHRLKTKPLIRAVLDVFENEPSIDIELLRVADLVTPHIAGYSVQGKEQGTRMVLDAMCRFFGVAAPQVAGAAVSTLDCSGAKTLRDIVLHAYDIRADDTALRSAQKPELPRHFDYLRKHYRARHEWANQRLLNTERLSLDDHETRALQALGFVFQ